jgi:hypothetical protein
MAYGSLSERAQRQAALLANDADLRLSPPRSVKVSTFLERSPDPRLPKAGTVLNRRYRNQLHQVQILANGFAYKHSTYRSLSAVAQAITGSHCNGFWFFRLQATEKHRAQDR